MTSLVLAISLIVSNAPDGKSWQQRWIDEHPAPLTTDSLRLWLRDQVESQPAATDYRLSPVLPVWPSSIPEPCMMGDRACLIRDGHDPNDLAIDPMLETALTVTLQLAERYTQVCQERIDYGWASRDETDQRWRAKYRSLAAELANGGSFQDWMVGLMVVGGVAVGVLLGYFAHDIMH